MKYMVQEDEKGASGAKGVLRWPGGREREGATVDMCSLAAHPLNWCNVDRQPLTTVHAKPEAVVSRARRGTHQCVLQSSSGEQSRGCKGGGLRRKMLEWREMRCVGDVACEDAEMVGDM